MTRKKFAEALFDAIAAFRVLASDEDETWETCVRFKGARAALIYGVDGNGTNEVGHYILVELQDGTVYRLTPERVLKLEGHEKLLWEDLKQAELEIEEAHGDCESDDVEDVDDSELEDDGDSDE
jgi:hypothetical protein